MRLVFNGRPQDTLVEGEDVIRGGEEFEVDAERAEELLTNPTVDVSEAKSGKSLARLTVAELKELAEEKEIDISETSNKADLIEAIEKAEN